MPFSAFFARQRSRPKARSSFSAELTSGLKIVGWIGGPLGTVPGSLQKGLEVWYKVGLGLVHREVYDRVALLFGLDIRPG